MIATGNKGIKVLDVRKALSALLLPLTILGPAAAPCFASLGSAYDTYAENYDSLDKGALADALGLTKLREQMGHYARGKVLEVAVGTGIQLEHYDWSKITAYTGIDFSQGMLDRARPKLESLKMSKRAIDSARLVQMNVESLELPSSQFDTVVDTFSFCVFPDPDAALKEMMRVTKPGGNILLLENSRSTLPPLGVLQDITEPLITPLSKGCRWNTDVPAIVARNKQAQVVARLDDQQGTITLMVVRAMKPP